MRLFGEIENLLLAFLSQKQEICVFFLYQHCTYQGSKVGISKLSSIPVPEDSFILANSVTCHLGYHSLQKFNPFLHGYSF